MQTSAQLLKIQLNLQESSLVLEALAEQPFKTVFELIGRLNHQAQHFYVPNSEPIEKLIFLFTSKELACAINALGDLSYNRVNGLLVNLHHQLMEQKSSVTESVDENI